MEEGRILPVFRKKPRIILDKRFSFVEGLEVGDKGSLEITVNIESLRLEPDADGNEFLVAETIIQEAKPFILTQARV